MICRLRLRSSKKKLIKRQCHSSEQFSQQSGTRTSKPVPQIILLSKNFFATCHFLSFLNTKWAGPFPSGYISQPNTWQHISDVTLQHSKKKIIKLTQRCHLISQFPSTKLLKHFTYIREFTNNSIRATSKQILIMTDKYDCQPRVDNFVIHQHLATSKQVADHTLGYQKHICHSFTEYYFTIGFKHHKW